MSPTQLPLGVGEAERLDECVLEQIHVPGAVQPHGVLITVDLETFTILQVSSNAADLLGTAAEALLGVPLVRLVGPGPIAQFREIQNWEGFGSNPVAVAVGEHRFDAIFHEADGLGVVEFERHTSPGRHHAPIAIYAAVHRLAGAVTVADLLAWSAREIRHLTKFDHVMVYEFHPDGHGEVVAESREPDVQPYLGLHFPASDIPIQARRLYLKKLSRVIVSTNKRDAQLVPALNPLTGEPVNLALSELRAISPQHIQFMKNMGQSSTMSFSLVQHGELIGMITCAHRSPKYLPYALRQGYEMLARQVALQWDSMAQIDRLTRRNVIRAVRIELNEQLRGADSVGEALTGFDHTLTSLVHADGGAVRVHGQSFMVDDSPGAMRIGQLFDHLDATGEGYFVSEALSVDRPDLAALLPGVAGLAIVPFGVPGNYLAWFRGETIRTVEWLGEQSAGNRLTPMSPRNSFAAWSESVSGRSLPWDDLELLEAAELSRDLDAALLNRMLLG